MGIKLQWDSQADLNVDSIEIYRSQTPIDLNNLPAVLATVGGGVLGYEDYTVKNGNVYRYRIATVKDNTRVFSSEIQRGYFADTGPGRADVIRGNWEYGFFGEIPPVAFTTLADLFAKLPSKVGLTTNTEPAMWAKTVYRGKILFVPNVTLLRGTWQNFYNAGLLYGTNDFGLGPSGVAGNVNQRTIVTIGNYQYIVRALRYSDAPTDKLITKNEDMINSEWKRCVAPLFLAATVDESTMAPRTSDWTATMGASAGVHHQTLTALVGSQSGAPDTLTAWTKNDTLNMCLTLELVV